MELKQQIGNFELRNNGWNTTEDIMDRMSDIQLEMIDNGTISALIDRDEAIFGIVADYNTIIYYEYVAENTVGGAVFVNLEPISQVVGYTMELVLYDEYDGHVEELKRYTVPEMEKLIQELPEFIEESEKAFEKMDKEGNIV